MYDDFYQMYLEELEAVAEAGPEEELSLLERLAAGDVSARERLIEGNLKRVLEYAKEYDGRGLPMGDLVQEGNMALTALAMEYESGAFQELLRERVRACIEAALEEQRMEAEIEENVAARVNVLQEVSRVMAKELGREATVEEPAAKMKMTEDEIRDIMKVTLDAVNVGTAMRMNLDGDGNEPESDPFGLEEP
mgnify:FL=1